ncbi:hypothetical protein ACOSQ2_013012 [Xanthoceras sorbifolium]
MVENQFQTKISILYSDNGTEFFNQHLSSFLTENDIQRQSTCRNTPQHRVLKHDTPLNYLKNCFPTNRLSSSLPLKFFGCTLFVHQLRLSKSKLDARAEKCVY